MDRFKKHKLWIITVLLTAPVVVLAAVPNSFTAGTVISAAQVNANFTALDTRITALETAVGRTGVQVLALQTGALPKAIAFTTNGNPIALIVSGSAYSGTAGAQIAVTVQLDAANIGELRTYTNEGGSHKAFPTRVIRVAAAAGSHTLNLLNGAGTTTDGNDFFSVTVVELLR